jgi:carboxypeptidase T
VAVYSVIILADSLTRVTALRGRGLDLHERAARRRPDSGDYAVPAILTTEEIRRLEAEGYRVVVQADAERYAVERAAEVSPDANRFQRGSREDPRGQEQGARRGSALHRQESVAGTLERLMDLSDLRERAVLGGYLTPDEIESALEVLAATYSATASVSPLPERSWEGRTSHVLHLRAGTRQERPGVLITGGMHAREWGGSDICVAFATNLLRSYHAGTSLRYGNKTFPADVVRRILEDLDVFVIADVNPDGKAYSQSADPGRPENSWWRKNRRMTGMPSGVVGVDLNRNFDFLWASGIGTEADPRSFTYKGPATFSEPETRNVRWLLDDHGAIGWHVDVHSHGELILYSWGDDENQVTSPDQNFLNPSFDGKRGVVGDSVYREYIPGSDQSMVIDLATGMNAALNEVRGKSYTVDQAVGLYPTSATSDDYAFSRHRADATRHKVFGFTIEFGEAFVPPYAEMRNIMADVGAALTELCRRAAVASHQSTNMAPLETEDEMTTPIPNVGCANPAQVEESDIRLAIANLSNKQAQLATLVADFISQIDRPASARSRSVESISVEVSRIVGGFETQPGDYPDCALIGHQNPSGTFRWFCTGVLVHPRVVVTAAHCARDINVVALDALKIHSLQDAEIIGVRKVVPNPLWKPGVPCYDIAVLILRQDARVAPTPVATQADLAGADTTTLVGFGNDDVLSSKGFGTQREVTVDIMHVRRTPRDDLDADEQALGFESDCEFVAGGGGYDSCNGDSGGPAYIDVAGGRRVAGLTSRGTTSATSPCGEGGIYTRVDVAQAFIDQVMSDNGVPGGGTVPTQPSYGQTRPPFGQTKPSSGQANPWSPSSLFG